MSDQKRRLYDNEDRKDVLTVVNEKGAVHTVTRMHFEKFKKRDGLTIVEPKVKEKRSAPKKTGK